MTPVIRILVVDDDEGWRELIKRWLTEAGCEVRTCGRAVEALPLAVGFKPQAAVLDYDLGEGGRGTEIAKSLRALPGMRDIAIIIVTTIHQSMLKMPSEGPFDQFIAKDSGRDELLAVLQGLVPGFRAGWTPPPQQS